MTTTPEGDNMSNVDGTFVPTSTTQDECKRGTLTFTVDGLIESSAFIYIDHATGELVVNPAGNSAYTGTFTVTITNTHEDSSV